MSDTMNKQKIIEAIRVAIASNTRDTGDASEAVFTVIEPLLREAVVKDLKLNLKWKDATGTARENFLKSAEHSLQSIQPELKEVREALQKCYDGNPDGIDLAYLALDTLDKLIGGGDE